MRCLGHLLQVSTDQTSRRARLDQGREKGASDMWPGVAPTDRIRSEGGRWQIRSERGRRRGAQGGGRGSGRGGGRLTLHAVLCAEAVCRLKPLVTQLADLNVLSDDTFLFSFLSLFLWLRPASRFDRHFQTHRTRLGRPFIAYQLSTRGPHIVTSYVWAGVATTDQIRSGPVLCSPGR